MAATEIVVEGTLHPDGTLELDEKLGLPPGRVVVTLRQTPQLPAGDWWQVMRDTRQSMADAGSRFMDDQEMQAHLDWLREGDPVDELLRDADAHAHKPGSP
jgi:hypothetical protein